MRMIPIEGEDVVLDKLLGSDDEEDGEGSDEEEKYSVAQWSELGI